jgi:hypothetical protein
LHHYITGSDEPPYRDSYLFPKDEFEVLYRDVVGEDPDGELMRELRSAILSSVGCRSGKSHVPLHRGQLYKHQIEAILKYVDDSSGDGRE